MGDVNITVSHSTFKDNSSVVRDLQMNSKEIDFDRIVKELQEIKADLKQGGLEYQVVDTLEKDGRKHNLDGLTSTIKSFTALFAAPTLANLAGAYLSKLFHLG